MTWHPGLRWTALDGRDPSSNQMPGAAELSRYGFKGAGHRARGTGGLSRHGVRAAAVFGTFGVLIFAVDCLMIGTAGLVQWGLSLGAVAGFFCLLGVRVSALRM
jgi:hypothetical protein